MAPVFLGLGSNLHERLFVLPPFAEIAPDFRHPLLGPRVAALRDRCPDPSLVGVYTAPGVRG